MLTPARLGLFACALFLAGCGKSDEIDDPPIQRLVGDWAPAVLENCDLRVKFGSNAIYVLRDGKIVSWEYVEDTLGLLRQLGQLPS